MLIHENKCLSALSAGHSEVLLLLRLLHRLGLPSASERAHRKPQEGFLKINAVIYSPPNGLEHAPFARMGDSLIPQRADILAYHGKDIHWCISDLSWSKKDKQACTKSCFHRLSNSVLQMQEVWVDGACNSVLSCHCGSSYKYFLQLRSPWMTAALEFYNNSKSKLHWNHCMSRGFYAKP